MSDPTDVDDEDAPPDSGPSGLRLVTLTAGEAGARLDKILAEKIPALSRARLQA